MRWHPHRDYHGTREYEPDPRESADAIGRVALDILRQRLRRLFGAFKRPLRLVPERPATTASADNWSQLDRWDDEGGAIAPPSRRDRS